MRLRPSPRGGLGLLGGAIFLGVFLIAYLGVPGDLYQSRDDGIITMSHARNLVEYGFIGVSPSGPRVEGYSAPLQMFLVAATHMIARGGYDVYAKAQTLLFTFLLGVLFFRILDPGDRRGRLAALAMTTLSAVFLTGRTSFFLWHGSGMENPITHCAFLGAAAVLTNFAHAGRIRYGLALVPFLASISRAESVFHIAFLLAGFSIFWLVRKRSAVGILFSLAVLVLWLAFQIWRTVYFGGVVPNTALAQGTEVLGRVGLLARLHGEYLRVSFAAGEALIAYHGMDVLVPFLPLLVLARKDDRTVFLLLASLTMLLGAFLHPLFFGRTLLDPGRTTTHAPVFVAVGASALIIAAVRRPRVLAWAGPILLVVAFLMHGSSREEPAYLCCSPDPFEAAHAELLEIAEREALPRPTIASPDLGVLSWHKDCNVVDLGMLGSPILSRFQFGPLPADYFFDDAAPDLIECHGNWLGRYGETLFQDPRFGALYEPVRFDRGSAGSQGEAGREASGIWIRKAVRRRSESRERRLIDELRSAASIDILRRELAACRAAPGADRSYVARTAYRYLPEIRKAGRMRDLADLFAREGDDAFQRYVTSGWRSGRASRIYLNHAVQKFLDRELGTGAARPEPIVKARFDVYVGPRFLIYLRKGCSVDDRRSRFYAELTPAGGGPVVREEFNFRAEGYDTGDWCLVAHPLPALRFESIRTGAAIAGEKVVWSGEGRAIEALPPR